MKIGSLIYIFIISFGFLFGGKDLKQANKAYKQEAYLQAITLYEKHKEAQEGQKIEPGVAIKMAHCYNFLNDFEKAKHHFELAGEANLTGKDRNTYGSLLFLQGDFEKAKEIFETSPEYPENAYMLQRLNWVEDKKSDTSVFVIEKTDINTFGQSFGVQYYQGGIVFSSSSGNTEIMSNEEVGQEKNVDLKGLEFLNLYYSPVITNGELGQPVLFSENLKFDYHVGAVTFAPDFKTMYYTKVTTTENDNTVLKIFSADYKGGTWQQGRALNINSDDFNCAHPALSITGDTLYFVSDKPGGIGGKDIYFSKKINAFFWSEPKNLSEVNTKRDELFPFVSKHNTLYFSSNGHPGYGGLDVFKLVPDDSALQIKNLKYGINTRFDDFAFTVNPENEKEGFISSNRTTSGRFDNIYRFYMAEPVASLKDTTPLKDSIALLIVETPMIEIETQVSNALSGDPIADVLLTISDIIDNSLLFEGETDKDGKASFKIEEGLITSESEIKISAQAKGKFEPFERIEKGESFLNSSAVVTDINLVPIIEQTQTITIPQNKLNFALNSFELSYEAKKILERWFQYLDKNRNIRLRLNAHTDSQGDLDYNLRLSQRRADNSKNYLVQRGIDPERIISRGYGERYILNHCKDGVACSDEEHEVNRRLEIIVIVD